MGYRKVVYKRAFFLSLFFFVATASSTPIASAASLLLSWQDNSNNEDGFKIERATNNSYAEIASVGPNVKSYTDSGLVTGTTYCYRVRSFNSTGVSSPSNESCTTISVNTLSLGLTKSGTGSGTVTSNPSGITCGSDCSEAYSSGTVVSLIATPAAGSTFAGWNGDSDCVDGLVTMNTNKSCTATFTLSITSGPSNPEGGSETASSLVLGWQDNSANEDGFKIERATNNSYAEIASVGPNVKSYTDSGLVAGTTYCYRVRSFNSTGVSSPSNESCTTISVNTLSLGLTKSGTGSGTVTSNPSGITCGSDCSEAYSSGTVVSLIATAAAGSTFAGWNGDSDCVDGLVTMNANKSCAATFNINVSTYTLTVSATSGLSSEGSGSGTVTSAPAGINCGSDCSETYPAGTVIALTATPTAGSIFAGWSGDADCLDGVVTMNVNKSCTTTFKSDTATLTVVKSGDGTVASNPAGINCGSECAKSYAKGTKVTLTVKPGPDGKFAGWAGGGCQGTGDCTVTLETNTSVSAAFLDSNRVAIGIFRSATGEWFLDLNGNRVWEGCNVDLCLGPFGTDGDLPMVGNWTGDGVSNIGVFRPSTAEWLLDLNGNGKWDGCNIDRCLHSVRAQESLPIVGDWTGSGIDMIGEMVFSGRTANWYLDLNGDGMVDNCSTDACLKFPSDQGNFPVSGDWNGNGKAKIGTFRPAKGEWFLDLNGDGKWKNCNLEKCVESFGAAGDRPVAGDWTGNGRTNIGVYRSATGEWLLDLNGNDKWNGCGEDACIQFIGKNPGDLPVVGRW